MVPDRSTQPPPGSRESESRSVSGRLPSAEVVRVVVPSAHIPVSRGVFRFPGRGPGRSSAGMTAIRSTWLVVYIFYLFSSLLLSNLPVLATPRTLTSMHGPLKLTTIQSLLDSSYEFLGIIENLENYRPLISVYWLLEFLFKFLFRFVLFDRVIWMFNR